ncbi:MAG: tRNA uridine-5-carboxymethylaminomethyl(34) synthesis GTPase MnmE [Bacteroidota bacterium]
MLLQDTIAAPATAAGLGAIAVIRVSGKDAIAITSGLFSREKGKKKLTEIGTHRIVFGRFVSGEEEIDEILVSLFRAPHSYTGEDTTEISCHGSPYIQERIMDALLQAGCRKANPGEFTLRAFMNGKLDLTQAEAVAELISAQSKAHHQLALQQLRGSVGKGLEDMREQLIRYASLLELELDFSEEDVEFANRNEFMELMQRICKRLQELLDSFKGGNAVKNGIPVTIAGAPNTGKSTLLNALVGEEKAIVSPVAGTTRDVIEDVSYIKGVAFRFIDTAGIRSTEDTVEQMGIVRTFARVEQASIVFYLAEPGEIEKDSFAEQLNDKRFLSKRLLLLVNKCDLLNKQQEEALSKKLLSLTTHPVFFISALHGIGMDKLRLWLEALVEHEYLNTRETVLISVRHSDAIRRALDACGEAMLRMEAGMSGELVAQEVRESLYYLGLITGKVSTEDLLDVIFRDFCIGK